jgi:uncharacterized protein (DUF2235 family)
MGRNIVICSDGTGNTFDKRVTNVTGLVWHLTLDDPGRQLVLYDQGLGTTEVRELAVAAYVKSLGNAEALHVLRSQTRSTSIRRTGGLLFGYGLKENVRQLYTELACHYRAPDDRVFLFGFSRGAFTVRALAGLLYRFPLPDPDFHDVSKHFEHAWRLYRKDRTTTVAMRDGDRWCPIHFLGIWDTVKSYGGLNPIALPHLRHNPAVRHIRHALALHERRAWFQATTWGRLDHDREFAMTRLTEADRDRVNRQSVDEVWFAGSHSDVGGGNDNTSTARITLRWMLGEAISVSPRLRLNDAGNQLLAQADEKPTILESRTFCWRIAEYLPRLEIDNTGRYPRKCLRWGATGRRAPFDLLRAGTVGIHVTTIDSYSHDTPPDVRDTKRL